MKDFLAPSPVNFKTEIVQVDGKTYEVQYDGKRVTIEEVGKLNWFRQETSPKAWFPILVLVSAIFWAFLIRWVVKNL